MLCCNLMLGCNMKVSSFEMSRFLMWHDTAGAPQIGTLPSASLIEHVVYPEVYPHLWPCKNEHLWVISGFMGRLFWQTNSCQVSFSTPGCFSSMLKPPLRNGCVCPKSNGWSMISMLIIMFPSFSHIINVLSRLFAHIFPYFPLFSHLFPVEVRLVTGSSAVTVPGRPMAAMQSMCCETSRGSQDGAISVVLNCL